MFKSYDILSAFLNYNSAIIENPVVIHTGYKFIIPS